MDIRNSLLRYAQMLNPHLHDEKSSNFSERFTNWENLSPAQQNCCLNWSLLMLLDGDLD